jgi:hypothetical protein
VDNPEDRVSAQTYGFGLDGQDKGVYKAISGARKYGIFGLLNLMAGDDDPESSLERNGRKDDSGVDEDTTFIK